jgi:hypothetical protein
MEKNTGIIQDKLIDKYLERGRIKLEIPRKRENQLRVVRKTQSKQGIVKTRQIKLLYYKNGERGPGLTWND